ncbi:MAG TPA: hypothetical protein VJ890_14960 [Vineibacter sp.]|nr:hypothetical protein [Vineibacter sp.]
MEAMLVRCYAEGRQGEWQAFCLDFDLAVQGTSFDEVNRKLAEQIDLYLESVMALPERDRDRMLNRSMPLGIRLKFFYRLLSVWWRTRDNRRQRHGYNLPVDGAPAPA